MPSSDDNRQGFRRISAAYSGLPLVGVSSDPSTYRGTSVYYAAKCSLMIILTISVVSLGSGGDNTSTWRSILWNTIQWGAVVFVVSWPLSALMRLGRQRVWSWLEGSLFWVAPVTFLAVWLNY